MNLQDMDAWPELKEYLREQEEEGVQWVERVESLEASRDNQTLLNMVVCGSCGLAVLISLIACLV